MWNKASYLLGCVRAAAAAQGCPHLKVRGCQGRRQGQPAPWVAESSALLGPSRGFWVNFPTRGGERVSQNLALFRGTAGAAGAGPLGRRCSLRGSRWGRGRSRRGSCRWLDPEPCSRCCWALAFWCSGCFAAHPAARPGCVAPSCAARSPGLSAGVRVWRGLFPTAFPALPQACLPSFPRQRCSSVCSSPFPWPRPTRGGWQRCLRSRPPTGAGPRVLCTLPTAAGSGFC